ncbi:hypothetical protein B0H13DRAFT_2129737 [Mycena leptocephala]|nr:hypothetical protein B0H13DRAFT_2129737 [Mycena leptocephala]
MPTRLRALTAASLIEWLRVREAVPYHHSQPLPPQLVRQQLFGVLSTMEARPDASPMDRTLAGNLLCEHDSTLRSAQL